MQVTLLQQQMSKQNGQLEVLIGFVRDTLGDRVELRADAVARRAIEEHLSKRAKPPEF